jgi:hypothetical protein
MKTVLLYLLAVVGTPLIAGLVMLVTTPLVLMASKMVEGSDLKKYLVALGSVLATFFSMLFVLYLFNRNNVVFPFWLLLIVALLFLQNNYRRNELVSMGLNALALLCAYVIF